MNEHVPIIQAAAGDPQLASAPVTILTNDNGNLTKTFSMDEQGKVKKQAAAKLVRGTFKVHHVHNLTQLDMLLDSLQPTQAVTYGRPEQSAGIVVAQSITPPPAGAITRTRDNFTFGINPGILMLDYDPPNDSMALSALKLIAMLRKSCPELDGVAMLWRPSASSGVAGAEVRGQRVYIMVNDASQIKRVGDLLFARLWLAGFGYFAISKSGQVLERGPIDTSVWKPEGLDFAAAPVLGSDVTRTPYKSMVIDGCIFDVSEFKELTSTEVVALKEIKDAAREAIKPAVMEMKEKFIAGTAEAMPARLKALGVDADAEAIGVMVERATMRQLLMGNWPLTTADGKSVTVGMVMDNPDKYHNTRFADPLEPGYDQRVAIVNLRSGGRHYLYSHAHHGVRYLLDRAPAVINVNVAELPRMVDAMADIMKKSGELYERAGAMVYVSEYAKIMQAKPQWLSVMVQRLCRFEAMDKKGNIVALACPPAVVNGLLADAANLRMDKLTAVRNAPTMDHDGRQIIVPGYDKKTGLLLVNDQFGSWPSVPMAPSRAELQKAFHELWIPFSQFPYATTADKSVALAAVLTSAVRSCLRTSPGFGFSATAPGTGKTLLGQCIGALYDGVAPAVSPPCSHEDEWAKSLFSAALGGAGTMLFDNAEHAIESASLCAVTTAPAIKSRVLGESRDAEAEHRMLILATGNGLQFVGDLNRRFFVCRLDANVEASKVAAREFNLEPLGYCLKNRLKMITAALTLIQGYVRAGFPRVCDGLASMDDWNKLVRSTIVWLVQQGVLVDFVDPKTALTRDSDNDPDAAMLVGLLDTAKSIFGTGRRFTVAEFVSRAKVSLGCAVDLLLDIAGDRGEVDSKKLGRWMLKREGRIMNGIRIKRGPLDRTKKATWEVCTA